MSILIGIQKTLERAHIRLHYHITNYKFCLERNTTRDYLVEITWQEAKCTILHDLLPNKFLILLPMPMRRRPTAPPTYVQFY